MQAAQARNERGAAALAAIAIKPRKRHALSSYTSSLLFTATHLELTQGAIADRKLDEASNWFSSVFPREEKDLSTVVPFLIRTCGFLWQHFRHERYGAELLSWLVDLCERMRPRFYHMNLWHAYVLSLTAVTAGVRGLTEASDYLRGLTKDMPQLGSTVLLVREPLFLSQHDLVDCKAFVHGGIAFQALLHVEADVSLGLTDIVFAAQGFVVRNMWHYREQWVSLLDRAFRVGDVTAFKCGDHSQAAVELVSACLTIVHELEEQGETGSPAHSTADILWVHILRSLSFLGLVRALKHLILVRRSNQESLVDFLSVGQSIMSSIWHGEVPATKDDDAAYKELKELLHGLYDSTDIHIEQDDRDPTSFKHQLKVVRTAVRFYMFVVLTAARGEGKHSSELLNDAELDLAEKWLLCLNEQGHAAKPADGFLALELEDALSVLNLALVLNHDPLCYEFGLPLD